MVDTYVFIDDTGTPGQKSCSKYGGPSLCSWFAIIVSTKEKLAIENAIEELKKQYLNSFGLDEFHFVDLYNGKKQYRQMSIDIRFEILYKFADIYKNGNYQLFVQSMTKEDYNRLKIKCKGPVHIANFDLADVKDFALVVLLWKLNLFFEKKNNTYSLPIRIIIDEGRQKNGSNCKIGLLGDKLKNRNIEFKSSKSEFVLQFIDFIAFSLNRNRLIMSQNKKSEIDLKFLRMTDYADFKVEGLKRGLVNYTENMTQQYDQFIDEEYRKYTAILESKSLEEFRGDLMCGI